MLKKLFVISLLLFGFSQFAFGQKAVSPAKKKLVSQLAENTVSMFPVQTFDNIFKTIVDKAITQKGKELADSLTTSVDESKWSDAKKAEIKANIPAFIDRIFTVSSNLMYKDFDIKSWTQKALEKNCQKQFTITELKKLNKYFGSESGKTFAAAFNRVASNGITADKKDSFNDNEVNLLAEMIVVVGEPTMKKFMDVVVSNVMDEISKSVEVWGDKMLKNLEKESETGVIKKELEKFVSDNI